MNFPQATQHLTAMGLSQPHQWTPLAIKHAADIVWDSHQSLGYAPVPLVDPQHVLWALDAVVADTTAEDSTGVLARFLEDIMANTRDRKLGFLFFWYGALFFLCKPSPPWAWRFTTLGYPWWASGHQRIEPPTSHQCKTYVQAPLTPGWKAVGWDQSPGAHQLPR